MLQVKSQIGSAEKEVWESLGEKDSIFVSVNCPFKSQLKIINDYQQGYVSYVLKEPES